MALIPIQSVDITVTLPDSNHQVFTLEAPNEEEEPFGFGFREIKLAGKYRDGDNYLQKGHSTYRFFARFAYHSHNMDIRYLLVAKNIELRFPPDFQGNYQVSDVLLSNEEAVRNYLAGLAVGDEVIETDGVVLEFSGRNPFKWNEIFGIGFDKKPGGLKWNEAHIKWNEAHIKWNEA